MALKPGTQLGPYEVLAPIGAGGMGEVYKARDTRLNRTVAIKVLAAHLALNAELRERFRREAETIANLNHPNICTLYDIGEQEGTQYLVMEYLEGETVAARLLQGPLPLDQVLRYAIEISDALDKAHRKGATHRDIKPANIMLTKAGSKLLDFGLAKLKQQAAKPGLLDSDAPTPPGSPAKPSPTLQGTILGTLQYMAPEQVEGKVDEIDSRTDIFSFGATVYEMATGKKAFEGKSQASVIAAILATDPPPMSSLQPMTPPALDRVVRRCLNKEPDQRWQSAADLCQELQWIKEGGHELARAAIPDAMPAAPRWKRRLLFSALGLAAWAITAFAIWTIRTPLSQPVSRLTITLPAGQRLAALDQPAIAISPDGKNIVYVAVQVGQASTPASGGLAGMPVSTGTQQLYLRPLDSMESKPIAGTEGASEPFYSPDGQWIGFFAGGKLKKISINGGTAVALANASFPGGASWSSQGIVAFQGSAGGSLGLQQVSAASGPVQPLTRPTKGDGGAHTGPEFLPGGKALLFNGGGQIAVQPIGSDDHKNLTEGMGPRYAATGHLFYTQRGTMMAAPFDARRLALTGAAVPVLEGVLSLGSRAQYSVSTTGTLIYVAGGTAEKQNQMAWVSRNAKEQLLPAVPQNYRFPRVSPNGKRVALDISSEQVWIYDILRDTLSRLTFQGGDVPTWSPDGKRIAFQSPQGGTGLNSLYWQPADGGETAELLRTGDYQGAPNSFSPDGQLLAFNQTAPETGRDIWILHLADGKAEPFIKTPYEETAPAFSPDGKWLAYCSDESGRREIYVQPYPGPGGKWQVSNDGGQEPVWNPRGGELFYRNGTKMMAVAVDTKAGFSAGKPQMLFEGPYLPSAFTFPYYGVSPDGQRFLMLKPVESEVPAPTQINVVLNWFEELKRKVPVK